MFEGIGRQEVALELLLMLHNRRYQQRAEYVRGPGCVVGHEKLTVGSRGKMDRACKAVLCHQMMLASQILRRGLELEFIPEPKNWPRKNQ